MYWQDNQSMLKMLKHDDMMNNEEETSKVLLMLNICDLICSLNGLPAQYDFDEISGEDDLTYWKDRQACLDGLDPVLSGPTLKDGRESRKK